MNLSGGSFPLDDPAVGGLAGRKLDARDQGRGDRRRAGAGRGPDRGDRDRHRAARLAQPADREDRETICSRSRRRRISSRSSTARSGCGSSRGGSAGWTRRAATRSRSPTRLPHPSPVERPVMSAAVLLAGRRPRLPAGVSCGVRAGSRHRRLRRDREGLASARPTRRTASTSSASTTSSPRRRAVPKTRSPSSGTSSRASTSCWHIRRSTSSTSRPVPRSASS